MDYSYCESVTATGTSPWHIRRLTEIGRKLGGGADTPALCGREVSWDLGGNEVTAESVERISQWPPVVCVSCVAVWREHATAASPATPAEVPR